MQSRIFALVLLVFALSAAPTTALERDLPISGTVMLINPALRTFELGGRSFHVPQDVNGFEGLATGDAVLVHYKHVGGSSEVSKIEAAEPN